MVGPITKMVNAVTGGSPAYANSPRPATPLLRSHRNLRTPRPFRQQGTQASADSGHNGSNGENPISQAAEKVVDGVKTAAGHAANKMAPAGMRPAREGGNDPYTDMPSSEQDTAFWTTNTGAPVYDNDHSLKIGPRGPILLEDYQLLEKLAMFDRERIPERVVHARGATAKGYFEVTHDISNLSCAEVFSRVGHKTPVLARFSTVIHSKDSPETLRDVRGFSVKFYTKEGNWDFVGNDIPVFFIRDGMKFPDLVHALKPNPRTNIQEPWRILDFLSHFPESTHILTWLQDDAGIPKDYRHMPGFGVHTWKLVNKEGRETFVKFHFKTRQGEEYLLKDEAAKVAAENHSHATKDLFDSIERGDFPKWDLYIQTMEQEDEQKFEFDPLDNTKIWPEEQFPLQPVGTLVLDTNIDNFFAENESVAFSPSSLVPGIAPSDDPLLQTRLFSYSDTQRYRLGPNYLQLPANAPKTAYHNNHYDGLGNFMIRKEEVNYWPSRHLGEGKHPAVMADKHPEPKAHDLDGGKPVRSDLPVHDDFKQGGDRYRSLDAARQERMVERFATWMSHPRVQEDVRDIWYGYFTKMDASLGEKVRAMTAKMIESKPDEARAALPAGPPKS